MQRNIPAALAVIGLAVAAAAVSGTSWFWIQDTTDKLIVSGLSGVAVICLLAGGIMTTLVKPTLSVAIQVAKPIPRRRGQ